jgi:outer membrane protein TolC
MRKNIYLYLFFLSLFSFFISYRYAFAETLEEAWKIALSVDNRLIAGQKNVEAMEQSLFAAKSNRLPNLSIESSYTMLNESPAAILNMPGMPTNQITMSEDKSLSYKTFLTLPVFTGGRISNGINAASSNYKASLSELKKTSLDIKLNVVEAYTNVLRAKHWVDVTESNVKSLSSHVRDVSNLYEQGMITKNELLAANVSLADANQRLIQAKNNLDNAKAAYNRLLGRSLEKEVEIEDIYAEAIQVDIESLTSLALRNRPELSSLAEQADSIRFQADAVRASLYPQIAFSAGYNYQQNKYQAYEGLWTAILGLKWEIFDGGIVKHNANALIKKADSISKLREDASSIIKLQVRQVCLDIQETLNRINVTKDALKQSEENLRVTRDRYREGVGTNTEVLDAEALRIKSYNNYYNAVYDAVIAQYRLKYVTGTL